MIISNCKICNSEFKVYPYRLRDNNGKFCSKPCYFLSKKGKKLPENHPFLIGKSGIESYSFGKKHTEESKQKMRDSNIGKRYSINTEFKKGQMKNENNINWKGGITFLPEYNQIQTSKRSRLIKNNGHFSIEEWVSTKEKYNFSCLCCKKQEPFIKLSPDHVIPLSRGGKNTIENIQPLCRECNGRKWAKTVDYRNLLVATQEV